jgi:hypothetical protein
MASYIADNLKLLSQQHYIRKAGASDYWFDFTQSKLEQYRKSFSDDFCLILYASDTNDDAYILPYSHIKHLFADEYIDDRKRWVGSISGNLLHVRRSSQTMSLSAYYNAFEYLDNEFKEDDSKVISEPESLYNVQDEISLSDLQNRIIAFNEAYIKVEPRKQKRVSEYVARPNAITDYLKRFRNFTCQICGQYGFLQKNGTRYIEAHHIIEIHKLLAGSLCSDNIVILCPNCHRKFHYAFVNYEIRDSEHIYVKINDENFVIERNIISKTE